MSPTARVTKVELWAKRLDNGSETYHVATLDNGRYSRKYSARLSVPGKGVSVWARGRVSAGQLLDRGVPTNHRRVDREAPAVGFWPFTRNLC